MVLLVILLENMVDGGEYLLQQFTGQVDGGNYTYYILHQVGVINIVLRSVEGDADLYCSDATLEPTFDPNTHFLQSTTCGIDWVTIPRTFKRPVGIGVYGHPSHEESSYLMTVTVSDELDPSEMYQADFDQDNDNGNFQSERSGPSLFMPPIKEEEESILWAIFIAVLKVMLEIIGML